LGRSVENIDLDTVEVSSKASPHKKSKPILSQEEIRSIKAEIVKGEIHESKKDRLKLN